VQVYMHPHIRTLLQPGTRAVHRLYAGERAGTQRMHPTQLAGRQAGRQAGPPHAMAVPSWVAVPRPSSSRTTSERREAALSASEVSCISTAKVLSPVMMRSCAPAATAPPPLSLRSLLRQRSRPSACGRCCDVRVVLQMEATRCRITDEVPGCPVVQPGLPQKYCTTQPQAPVRAGQVSAHSAPPSST
jgi:hypothetical protein